MFYLYIDILNYSNEIQTFVPGLYTTSSLKKTYLEMQLT